MRDNQLKRLVTAELWDPEVPSEAIGLRSITGSSMRSRTSSSWPESRARRSRYAMRLRPMRAMVLRRAGEPQQTAERLDPRPSDGELVPAAAACGVCRTDLRVVDGQPPEFALPIVPGPANEARDSVHRGRIRGAAVLAPSRP